MLARALLPLLSFLAWGCAAAREASAPLEEAAGAPRAAVEACLDAFHAAAARADGEAYFALLVPGAVFVGTDPAEHWDRAAFRAYAEPWFERGIGWTYVPGERHVWVAGGCAWFDERLANEKYGEVRGSGVLRRGADGWRIAHYVLSFPVPNELSAELVERVRALERR